MKQTITFSSYALIAWLTRAAACLMIASLSWQHAQAQVVIAMEDVPGKAAPTVPIVHEDMTPQSTLIQAPDIRLRTTDQGLVMEMPQGLTIEETEVLDLTGRRLTQVNGDYRQATLRSTMSRIALIRWHTNQGLIVRKVRL